MFLVVQASRLHRPGQAGRLHPKKNTWRMHRQGTIVKILNSGYHSAEVVEPRGPLSPKGARIDGVVVAKKPRLYREVREDQLEVLSEP